MRGKYRLLDKFIIISHFLAKASSEADSKQFKQIKDIRDQLLHGVEITDSDLPVHKIQDLLLRYLTKHLLLSKD